MIIIFDIGFILAIIAVIGILLFLGAGMGLDGICEYLIANPQQVILVCTLIFIAISIFIALLVVGPKRKNLKICEMLFYISTLTLSLSASTVFNIYNTVDAIQSWHGADVVMRLFLFPVLLLIIVFLIIIYIISYCVGSAPFIFYLFKHSDQVDCPDTAFKIFNAIWSSVLYAIIVGLLLSGNMRFMLVT